MQIDRRAVLVAIGAAVAIGGRGRAEDKPLVTVYKDPSCDCCDAWIGHIEGAGFPTKVVQTAGMSELKFNLRVPYTVRACHTAIVADYLVEGHVPAEAIVRLLAEKPVLKGGLAVPGMPVGSPGMEMPGTAPEEYDVLLFGDGEPRRFMRFRGGERI
ncbi:DUF411 domain-containing protein [Chelatococcus sambhunathii]|uniref:DUF411 domain-containing protein n=1 Tax=Chelatococcus sambhunathii TaxID=363953 RepID=A0ABU1DHI9_9HYPH|nr:DUF411 domain-containing protein [Chelatococcus sambhunathii]MDR4307552.1 DUF411 domain-containing protein [Chelatococcus sambhunathii]